VLFTKIHSDYYRKYSHLKKNIEYASCIIYNIVKGYYREANILFNCSVGVGICIDRCENSNVFLKGEKMGIHTKKYSSIVIISLFAFILTPTICNAQEYSRRGKSEIFGIIQTVDSMDVKYDYLGWGNIGFVFDSTNIYGIGFGTNATDHWNVNLDFLYGNTDAKLAISGMPSSFYSYDTDYFLFNLNVDYNILPDRFTPLLTAGVGIAKIDMEVKQFGYGYNLSASESNFSYNVGAGGRWDITDNILIKLIYRVTWTQLEDANDKQDLSGVALSIAYMF
jgi:opacity protein-like surface antigen